MKNDRSSTHRYPAYKDSGIEWLGEVPEHWNCQRLKEISKIVDCKNRTPEYFDEGDYLVIRTSNVKSGRLNLDKPSFTNESNFIEWTKRGVPPIGSILFTREAPAGEVCLVPTEYKSCLGQRMMNFIPKDNNDSVYLLYYFLSYRMKCYLESITSGSTVHHLRVPQVFDTPVIIPPLPEQKSIALYLDTATAKIDRKIDLLTQKAAKYGQLKRSIINEAVTRGLDRSVVMKDSGVEWIGEVPAAWSIVRNKEIFEERSSLSTTGREILLTVSHITGVTPRSEKNVNMFMAETMEGYKICKQGDLVINTMWAWMGALGTSNELGICSPAYNVYKPLKGIPYNHKYFDYLFRISGSIVEMTRNSKGIVSSRLRLYAKDFFKPGFLTNCTMNQ